MNACSAIQRMDGASQQHTHHQHSAMPLVNFCAGHERQLTLLLWCIRVLQWIALVDGYLSLTHGSAWLEQ